MELAVSDGNALWWQTLTMCFYSLQQLQQLGAGQQSVARASW